MMNIKKIEQRIKYNKKMKRMVNRLKPWNGSYWNKENIEGVCEKEDIDEIKKFILNYLLKTQGDYCAYCGNRLYVTSAPEIEHIAPKGGAKRPIHPEFTFTPLNLVLSCNYCNSSRKKGQKNVLVSKKENYRLCEFSIIHPYFDNPEDHLEKKKLKDGTSVLFVAKTKKGEKSIKMFKLNDEKQWDNRKRDELYRGFENISEDKKKIVLDLLNFK